MKKIHLRSIILILIFLLSLNLFASIKKIDVEFKYYAPDAKTVTIPMDITGWKKHSNPMIKGKDGWFRKTLSLIPGEYQYKFCVDNSKWVLDTANPKIKNGKYIDNLLKVGTEEQIKEAKKALESVYNNILKEADGLKKLKDLQKINVKNKNNAKLRFAVLGDNRSNTKIYNIVITELMKYKPEFIINTGDLVSSPNNYDELLEFVKISKKTGIPYLPAPGNHDIKNKQTQKMFSQLFGIPSLDYYTFTYGNCQFFMLDTEIPGNHSKIDGKQLEWLKKELAKSNAKYRFAAFHRPMYSVKGIGHHHKDSLGAYPDKRDNIEKLFVQYKVNCVYCGHEHFYNRQKHDSITQIITGGAGAPLYTTPDKGGFYHFLIVNVDKNGVHTKVYKYNINTKKFEIYESFDL